MKRNLISAMIVVSVAGWCFTASTASGEFIYNTVGTADEYTVGGVGDISYLPPSYHNAMAVAFTPKKNDYLLTTIEIGLAWYSGTGHADVWLMSDNEGKPGATIKSFPAIDLSFPDNYYYNPYTFQPKEMLLVQITYSGQRTLYAGTQYWVGASSTVTTGTTQAFWLSTNDLSFSYTGAYSLDGGSSWIDSSGDELPPALRVSGNIVPLPGAVWLLGTGLMASAGLLRRLRP